MDQHYCQVGALDPAPAPPRRSGTRACPPPRTPSSFRKGIATTENKSEADLVHLRLNGCWTANTDLYDFSSDHNEGLVSNALARSAWTKDTFQLVSRYVIPYASGPNKALLALSLGSTPT